MSSMRNVAPLTGVTSLKLFSVQQHTHTHTQQLLIVRNTFIFVFFFNPETFLQCILIVILCINLILTDFKAIKSFLANFLFCFVFARKSDRIELESFKFHGMWFVGLSHYWAIHSRYTWMSNIHLRCSRINWYLFLCIWNGGGVIS